MVKKPKYYYRALLRPDSLAAFAAFAESLPKDGPALGYAQVWHKPNIEPYTVANEYVAGRLGQMIGLPVPPFAITDYNGEPLFSSLDFNFERAKLPGVNPSACAACLPGLSAGVLVFDIWIANEDRWEENLLVDRVAKPKRMIAFDHEQALLGGHSHQGVERLRYEIQKLGIHRHMQSGDERPHCLLPVIKSSRDFFPWIARISKVPDYFIEDTCEHARELGVSGDEVVELIEFIRYRQNNLEAIIRQHQAGFPLIADWPWNAGGLPI